MNENSEKLGSDLFCEALIKEGVEVLFGYPGGVVLPLYDKINNYGGGFRHILPRQEQGGGFAADGYARATGKVGVALGTSGPGAANLFTCMVNSMMDSVPVVYVTGQVASDLIGTDAFQEADIFGMAMPSVKHSYHVTHAKDIQKAVREAFYIAKTGRPGPVNLDITKDAWLTKASSDTDTEIKLQGYDPDSLPQLDDGTIKKLDEILSEKDLRPVVIAGHGIEISKAQKELLIFAERHNLPVINTLLGLGSFPQGHPLWLGMMGMHGEAAANFAVARSNLIIGIGCRFDDRITGKLPDFFANKKIVHIDIDASEINKIAPTVVSLEGDAKIVLTRANKLLSQHQFGAWWQEIFQLKSKYGFLKIPQSSEHLEKLSQPKVIRMISEATKGEAIVAADVGRHQMWVSRFYRFKNPNSHLSSGGLGSMGYALPAAMGAKLGMPKREVWAISGDGGFQMNMQELGTIAEHNIPIKIAIMEDGVLGMVYQWQDLLYKKNIAHSIMKNPDFVMIAKAYGIPAWRVTTYTEAEEAIAASRKIDGPTLITFVVDADEHVYPMISPGMKLADQVLSRKDII